VAGDDHVLEAAEDPDVAVLVDLGAVPGVQPSAFVDRAAGGIFDGVPGEQ
jgi:hypothetical protein